MTREEILDGHLRRLLDRYMKTPDDMEGLAVVEGMFNEIFARVGAAPPRRIKLVLVNDVIHVGFEDEVPKAE